MKQNSPELSRNKNISLSNKQKQHINGGHQLYNNTAYTYINQLFICEYIERIDVSIYKKLKNIPTDLTSTKLAYMAYDKPYRLRVERKKKINNIIFICFVIILPWFHRMGDL